MKNITPWLIAATMCCACGNKQEQEAFRSTIINEDGTVTFNYRNDNAREVSVDVQFAGNNPMTLDTLTGIWSVTLGPAAPDMYPYHFVVDGVSIMDPECDQFFPNEGFKNSLLDIPGRDKPLIHTPQDVPHGSVDYVRYYSKAIGAYNNAIVYTPPTYNKDEGKSYPVFYLISGTTDTEEVYYKVGRMNVILDNLLAQGEAQEMIIVLPYGNPAKLINAPMQIVPGGMQDYFSNDLINDLMPYVESHYRTINDADHRAIGGFSRGGNQGLLNGLTHLDKFSYLCSYSSFTTTALPVYDNAEEANAKINLFWAGVGTDDFLYGNARDYTEFLDQKGITCVKEYTDDKFGHTWMNAKYFLDHTLRLLFNPEASAKAMAEAQPTKAKTGEEKQFTPGVMARLFPKPIVSPEVKGDSVTFRIKAEKAEAVLLEGDMLYNPTTKTSGTVAMQRDSDGVWSTTLTCLAQDVYLYNFIVDGTQVADAQNMYLAPVKGFKPSILDLAARTDAQIDYAPVRYQGDGTAIIELPCPITVAPSCPTSVESPCPATPSPVTIALVGNPECWHKIVKADIILSQLAAPFRLVLTEKDLEGADITLRAADYSTWGEARKALINAIKGK